MKEYSLNQIQVFMIMILSGLCTEEDLLYYLAAVADWGEIVNPEDWNQVAYNGARIWLEKSRDLILDKKYGEWIDYFKEELLKHERYLEIRDLHL